MVTRGNNKRSGLPPWPEKTRVLSKSRPDLPHTMCVGAKSHVPFFFVFFFEITQETGAQKSRKAFHLRHAATVCTSRLERELMLRHCWDFNWTTFPHRQSVCPTLNTWASHAAQRYLSRFHIEALVGLGVVKAGVCWVPFSQVSLVQTTQGARPFRDRHHWQMCAEKHIWAKAWQTNALLAWQSTEPKRSAVNFVDHSKPRPQNFDWWSPPCLH